MNDLVQLASPDPRQLALIGEARRLLSEARTLPEVKELIGRAAAVRKYFEVEGVALEVRNDANEILLRAQRMGGQFLEETPRATFPDPAGGRTPPAQPTLSDIGVSKDQSRVWRAVASVPEEKFDRYIEEAREAGQEITTSGLVKLAKEAKSGSTSGGGATPKKGARKVTPMETRAFSSN